MGVVREQSAGSLLSADSRGETAAAKQSRELDPLRRGRVPDPRVRRGEGPGMSREKRVPGIRRLLTPPASSRRVQRDVDDEIRFHIESRVAELVAAGTPVGSAREI